MAKARMTALLIAAALLPLGCSDPGPALTPSQFYDQAGEIQESTFGSGVNAWPAFVEALQAHTRLLERLDEEAAESGDPGRQTAVRIDAVRVGGYPRSDLAPALGALERVRESDILLNFDQAFASPLLYQPWDESLPVQDAVGEGLATGAAIRSFARTNLALLRVAAAEDRGSVPLIASRQLALTSAAASRLLVIDYLIGAATCTTLLNEINALALEGELTLEECGALLAMLESSPLPPIATVLETERLFALATLDSAIRGGVKRATFIEAIDDALKEALAHADDPYAADLEVHSFSDTMVRLMASPSGHAEFVSLMRSTFGQVIRNAKIIDLRIAATRAVLQLEAHRLTRGAYPATLDSIDAPTDPITGGGLLYRLTREGPAPYLLYSAGIDGVDNGGMERPRGDELGYPDPGDIGYDFVLVRPRALAEQP